jgi:hypothetical protein
VTDAIRETVRADCEKSDERERAGSTSRRYFGERPLAKACHNGSSSAASAERRQRARSAGLATSAATGDRLVGGGWHCVDFTAC